MTAQMFCPSSIVVVGRCPPYAVQLPQNDGLTCGDVILISDSRMYLLRQLCPTAEGYGACLSVQALLAQDLLEQAQPVHVYGLMRCGCYNVGYCSI